MNTDMIMDGNCEGGMWYRGGGCSAIIVTGGLGQGGRRNLDGGLRQLDSFHSQTTISEVIVPVTAIVTIVMEWKRCK